MERQFLGNPSLRKNHQVFLVFITMFLSFSEHITTLCNIPKMRHKRESTSYLVLVACLAFLRLFDFRLTNAADTLTAGKAMRDWEFLESQNKMFRLLFFYPAYSSERYLGIKFETELNLSMKMVWVANREYPLNDTSGHLNITQDGYLVISDERGTSITINRGKPATGSNTRVTLLNSGNLVLKAGQQVVWQSFDHPTDTILPGMKFGLFDLKLKQPRKVFLTSWLGLGVPAAGAFTLGVDPNNTRQLEVRQRGIPYWCSGNWNERNFSYFPFDDSLKFSYTSNENESYFTYSSIENHFSWIEMNSTGNIHIFEGDTSGFASLSHLVYCRSNKEYSSEGCIDQKPSKCSSGDEFVLIIGAMESWDGYKNESWGLRDCEEDCRNNCSCTAYRSASPDGSGCYFSYGKRDYYPFIEWQEFFYIRNTTAQNDSRVALDEGNNSIAAPVAPPVTLPADRETPRKKKSWVIIIVPLASLALLAPACSLCYFIWKKCFSKGRRSSSQDQVGWDTEQFIRELGTSIAASDVSTAHRLMLKGNMDYELPLFSFSSIEVATGHFSDANKLGQGGFGPVFKGTLVNRQEIAVKRLSERSSQGVEEFKNEVALISKVQHRNLVRLFGCSIKGEEKLLIYEYLPNKSLDTFLFDETKRLLLDWRMRINIIEGIAQGLLYLHKYSRLKIIHRDLKTSNILLDNNMNPKISDFGTAKIFGENESRANTNRIVGTYGYMSPEYAMDGLYSVKSDVFSFGVMMLEIISGKKTRGFYHSNHSSNLVGYAWNLWKEGKSSELMDPALAETCSTNATVRCVQVALLCVQDSAEDRPTMTDIVSMLISDTGFLPDPKEPAFFPSARKKTNLPDNPRSCSVNDATISSLHAR